MGYKHPLKFIWQDKAQALTCYSNFQKVLHKKFPYLRAAVATPREFSPGDRAEVDWAGGKVEWIDIRTGEIHEAVVFIGTLGYSQLLFAWAAENMKSRQFLDAHKKMYEFFGGVPKVTVPDCTKTAVLKCHIYDPDINPAYSQMGQFYHTGIVPARPSHPKDKALVELAVKLVMRLFRWLYRNHTFTSIKEINDALVATISKLNKKKHTRFGVSRLERFEKFEKSALRPLPTIPFESAEWKDAVLHPDCTVWVETNYYSAPHSLRGKTLQVKITETLIEIFYQGDRVANHIRYKGHRGKRSINPEHYPESSKAYFETTPQNLLSQARFLSKDLFDLVVEIFNKDTLAHVRIVQGLIRVANKHVSNLKENSITSVHISRAVATMRIHNRYRVSYFTDLLKKYRTEILKSEDREIQRKPGNPMLRYSQLLLPIEEVNNQGDNHGHSPI